MCVWWEASGHPCTNPLPQVLGLSQLGVRAAALTSLTSKEDAATISKQVCGGG